MSLLLDALQRASKDKALIQETTPVLSSSDAGLSLVDDSQTKLPSSVQELDASSGMTLEPAPATIARSADSVVAPAVEKAATQQPKRVAQDIRNAYIPTKPKPRLGRKVLFAVFGVWLAGLLALVLVLWNSPTALESVRALVGGGLSTPPTESTAMPSSMQVPMPIEMAPMGEVAPAAKNAGAETAPETVRNQTPATPKAPAKAEAKAKSEAPSDINPKKPVAKSSPVQPLPNVAVAEPRARAEEISAPTPIGSTPTFVAKAKETSPLELGYAALVGGNFDEAAKQYSQSLKSNPEERDALLGLAYIAQKKGLRDDATGLYRRVLRQDPNNPIANAGLLALDTDADVGQSSSRAFELASRQPDSAATMAVAGVAAVRAGQLADAAQLFARAQSLEPDNPVHAFNHAVALDRLGQVDAALMQYVKVLRLSEKTGAQEARAYSVDAVRQRIGQLREALRGKAESTK